MIVVPLVFAIAAGLARQVDSVPPSDIVAFPEETNGVNPPPTGEDRFHYEFRPETQRNHERYPSLGHYQPEYFRPPGSRPSTNYRPYGSGPRKGSNPSFSRPGDLRPQGSIPTGNIIPGQESIPTFPRPSGATRPFSRPQVTTQGSRPNGGFDPQGVISTDSGSSGPRPTENARPQILGSVNSRPTGGSIPSFLRPQATSQGSRPNGGVDFQDSISTGPRPSGSRPTANSRPQFSGSDFQRPSVNSFSENTNPEDTYEPSSFQPDFLAIGSSGSPDENTDSNGNSNVRPVDNLNPAVEGSTSSSTTETTTKIPRRDPTYRIVTTVSCPCAYTSQYEPVCGTDGQTYGNMAILQCAQQCGTDVKVFLVGSCGRNNGHSGTISLKY